MYFILLFYLIVLVVSYDVIGTKRTQNFNFWLSCILLILVAGLRYNIGIIPNDTLNYMYRFEFYPTLDKLFDLYNVEPLWLLINSACKSIYDDFFLVQLVQAIIVNAIVFWFIKRYSPKPFIAILLYYIFVWWNFSFEIMREAIAIAFYLYALDALLSKNSWKGYYWRVWPACLVHTFGFVTLLFPLIHLLKFKRNTFVSFGILLAATFVFGNQIDSILFIFDDSIADKVDSYLNSDLFGAGSLSFNGIVAYILGNIIPILIILFVFYRNREFERINQFIPYLFIYLVIIILMTQIRIFYRFLNYFEIIVIVSLTQALGVTAYKREKFLSYLTVLSLCIMISFEIYQLSKPLSIYTGKIRVYERYYPYRSIFDKDNHHDSTWRY